MRSKKWNDILFIAIILLFLILGIGKTVFFPKDLNAYENRYAVQIHQPTIRNYLGGTFQDNVESALHDQIPFAQSAMKLYHYGDSYIISNVLNKFTVSYPNQYFHAGNSQMFGPNITYKTRCFTDMQPELDNKIAGYNRLFEQFPDVEFYVYYIEKDTDINFETNEKVGCFDYLASRLTLDSRNISCFRVNSFNEFSQCFFCTDHHWNYKGSQRAYHELLSLLKCNDSPLMPENEIKLSTFSGSKAVGVFSTTCEPFFAFRYRFPEFNIQINGNQASDYGAQEEFFNGEKTKITYAAFYGGDEGEVILDTGRPERDNLLVLGESYDNALVKLLASHFDKTFFVDLRYYEVYKDNQFSLRDYLSENHIWKVLLIGNIDYFTMPEFLPGD